MLVALDRTIDLRSVIQFAVLKYFFFQKFYDGRLQSSTTSCEARGLLANLIALLDHFGWYPIQLLCSMLATSNSQGLQRVDVFEGIA